MPKRFIGDETRFSKSLDKISDGAHRMFWNLITVADDFGRFRADPAILKSECFPLRPRLSVSKVAEWYKEMEKPSVDLVRTYTSNGNLYGFFRTFNLPKHQGPPRAKKSRFPDPPENLKQGNNTAKTDENICKQILADSLVSVSVSDSVFDIPPMTANNHNGKDFAQDAIWLKNFLESQSLVDFRPMELQGLLNGPWWERTAVACNGLDHEFLEKEFAKMGNWLAKHNGRRPTMRFIQNWLVKAGEPQ